MKQDGILVMNKPQGISSFGFLKQVQRKLGLKKVGHLGTLDPAACGVLVLLCGKYTKRADELSQGQKVYQSVFTFGIETDTLDLEGKTVATSEIIPSIEQINNVLPSLVGDIEIEVPKFSAVHIGGRRAYDLARAGIDFTPPKRIINIERFDLLQPSGIPKFFNFQLSASHFFEVQCQTGTYIRSLAKLMAQKLGTVAIASLIIRTRVGQFAIQDAKTLDDVTAQDLVELGQQESMLG